MHSIILDPIYSCWECFFQIQNEGKSFEIVPDAFLGFNVCTVDDKHKDDHS